MMHNYRSSQAKSQSIAVLLFVQDTVDGEEVDAAGIGQRFEVPLSVSYRYLTDTEKGSSGAACFDDEWRLVCLHHAAVLSDAEVKRRQQGNLD